MNKSKLTPANILALAIVLVYIAGLVMMFAGQGAVGLTLWGISTVVGGVFLYIRHTRRRRAENEETLARAVADAQKNAKPEDDA